LELFEIAKPVVAALGFLSFIFVEEILCAGPVLCDVFASVEKYAHIK